MDWNQLHLILEIGRAGSLSGAARSIGVNHATVSRKLSQIEARAGVRFFERLPDGMVPTEEGRLAMSYAEKMEDQALSFDRVLASSDQKSQGQIALAVPALLADARFAEDLRLWDVENPGTEVTVLGDARVFNLHKREADVAIRMTATPGESLWGRKVVDQKRGIYASKGFVETYKQQLETGQGAVPVIGFSHWSEPILRDIRQRFPNAKRATTCDDHFVAQTLVRAGRGMTRLPCYIGESDPEMMRVPGSELTEYAPIWVLIHPDARANQRIAAFVSFIARRFRQRQALFLGQTS